MENQVSKFKQDIEQYSNNLVKELQNGGTENFKSFLKFSSNFHKYSANNRLLIQIQKPEATKVASFLKWKEMGRSVKKGEKSLKILAPNFRKSECVGENGQVSEKIDGVWFKTVSVFDISQTEGEELQIPTWSIRPEMGTDDKGLYNALKEQLEARGISVSETDLDGPLGVSYGGRIEIDSKQDQICKFLTLVHEAAHEILHKGSESKHLSRNDKECQAEATAYIVSSYFGLENIVSAEYIMHWGNFEKEFSKNLSAVVKASEEILEMLSNVIIENENLNQEVSIQEAA